MATQTKPHYRLYIGEGEEQIGGQHENLKAAIDHYSEVKKDDS